MMTFNPLTGGFDFSPPGGAVDLSGYATVSALALKLSITSNLSDLASAATARTNLGFTGAAVLAIADTSGLQAALNAKAPLASPTFTGVPLGPTAAASTNTTQLATTAFVRGEVAALVGAAPGTLDTLAEIAAALQSDESAAAMLTTTVGGKLTKASNLSDLTSASTARTNLGLGSVDNTPDGDKDVGTAARLRDQDDASDAFGFEGGAPQFLGLATPSLFRAALGFDGSGGVLSIGDTSGLQTALDAKVGTSGDQTIAGHKTFSGTVTAPVIAGGDAVFTLFHVIDPIDGMGLVVNALNIGAGVVIFGDEVASEFMQFEGPLQAASGIYDFNGAALGTGHLSIDPNLRLLKASDGTTTLLDFSNSSGVTFGTTAAQVRTNLGLGSAATTASTAYATAAQGAKADTAVQPGGTLALAGFSSITGTVPAANVADLSATYAALTASNTFAIPNTGTETHGLVAGGTFRIRNSVGATDIINASTVGTASRLGIFNATPVAQQTGDIATALTNYGLVTSPTLAIGNLTGFATGVATFLATPSSANLAAAVTGATGTGALVFGTSPNFTTGATIGSVAIPTISSTSTLTNKSIDLTSNTLTGTRAQFNTALSDDDFATLTGTETFTNKTLTSPKIGTSILDTNGNIELALTATSSAVNYLTLTNSASSTVGGTISANGTGTNLDINVTPKGSGKVAFTSGVTFVNSAVLGWGSFGGLSVTADGRFQYFSNGFSKSFTQTVAANGVMLIADGSGTAGTGTWSSVPKTPTQIAADQNNYNSGGNSYYQRWSTDASRNITGMTFTAAQVDGQTHVIVNVGSNAIVLVHENASSTAANRFHNSTGADITLAADQEVNCWYDATTARWRVTKRGF